MGTGTCGSEENTQLIVNRLRKSNLRLYLDHVLKEISADPFFVEIGAMDGILFDDLHEHIRENNWRGLLVEPLKDEFDKLVENYRHTNDRLRFANLAVTENCGRQRMVRVRDEPTRPLHHRGMSSCFTERNGLVDLKDSCIAVDVESVTLAELFRRFEIESIDILQVDTEGFDYRILRQLDFERIMPSVISFETCCLPADERAGLIELLTSNGYHLRQNGPADCIASTFPPPENVVEFDRV